MILSSHREPRPPAAEAGFRVGAARVIRGLLRLTLPLALAAAGACGSRPPPDGRLVQPAGQFSILIPDGWQVSRPAGLPFAIVSGAPDSGVRPNLFTDGVAASTNLEEAARDLRQAYRTAHPDHDAAAPVPFAAASGAPGLKIRAERRTPEGVRLALFHYAIQDRGRVIELTGSCAAPAADRYEPLFDAAVRSLQSTPHPGVPP